MKREIRQFSILDILLTMVIGVILTGFCLQQFV
jgi:hypothetical protein